MVSICECSQTYTAHSPRGWQETANGSSPFSRLSVKAVVQQAWKWFLKWVVCCLVAYQLVEFISKALNLGLVKSISLLFFCLFLKFVSVHHVLFVEEWYIEKHIIGISVFYKLCTFTQCFSPWSRVLSWVHWEEPEMEIQVPLGHRVWGGRKGQGKEGRKSWISTGKSLQPDPHPRSSGAWITGQSQSYLETRGWSRDLVSFTRSDWEGWEGPRQFSGEGAAVSWQPVLIAAEGVGALSQERKPGTSSWCQKLGEICDVCVALLNENQRLDLWFHVELQGWFWFMPLVGSPCLERFLGFLFIF